MFAVGLPELLLLGVGVLVVAVWLGRRVDGSAPRPSTREARVISAVRLLGVGLGAVAAWAVLEGVGGYGRQLLPAPAVFGLVVLGVVALGETVVRPVPDTGPRTASARQRRVRDYLPRRLALAVGVQALALVAALVLTTATASRDDHTDSVRALSCSIGDVTDSRTPYPGSFYSVPLAGVLVLVLLVTALAARQVVRRPRGEGGSDAALRARSLGVVTAAAGVAVSAPYLGVAVTAGPALQLLGRGVPGCAPSWAAPVGSALSTSALPSAALLVVCLALLVLGRPGFTPARAERTDLPVAR